MRLRHQNFEDDIEEIRKIARRIAALDPRLDKDDFEQDVLLICIRVHRILEAKGLCVRSKGLYAVIAKRAFLHRNDRIAARCPPQSYEALCDTGFEVSDAAAHLDFELNRTVSEIYKLLQDGDDELLLHAMQLKHLQFAYKEISQMLGVPVSTVMSLVRRVRKIVKVSGFCDAPPIRRKKRKKATS